MSRIIKAVIVALIAFLSVMFITKSSSAALAVALIPLVLGSLGIMVELAYGVAALCMIGAVAWSIMPATMKTQMQDMSASASRSKTP